MVGVHFRETEHRCRDKEQKSRDSEDGGERFHRLRVR